MRANADRAGRLAFDAMADRYDLGRPRVGREVTMTLVSRAGLRRGDAVLEIGAGTGQLTDGLLDAGLSVTALEPGVHLAARLRERHVGEDRLNVLEALLEDYRPPERTFQAVVSANAFHWVDPAISYARARELLRSGCALVLMWTFPILADPDLIRALNDQLRDGPLAGLARDPDGYGQQVAEIVREGRVELMASGAFDPPWWDLQASTSAWPTAAYAGFVSTLADAADHCDLLTRTFSQAFGDRKHVEVTEYRYLSVASRTD